MHRSNAPKPPTTLQTIKMASRLKDDLLDRRKWHKKWGILLDFNKIYLEEAAKRGVLEDVIKRQLRLEKKALECTCFKADLTPINVPTLSSAMIGWRNEYSLERMGKLYTSPLHTLPAETPVTHIKLG